MGDRMQKPRLSVVPVIVLGLLAVMFSPLFAHGQTFFGSIVGTVTDPSGAVVPGASIALANPATGDKRTATADASGNYRFLNLVPGRYSEEVDMQGFKHLIRQPIVVEVDSTVRIDLVMAIGAANEQVIVSAETPLLQANSSSLGQVIAPATVQEMPLNGRNVIGLISLVPGVVPQGGTSGAAGGNGGTGFTNYTGWNNFQIGGGLSGQSASFYDGSPINGLGGNVVVLVMAQDAVDEFRVATNAPSAEYGRFGGGVVSYTTKSGTNDLHGSGYEYFRNKALNASSYFQKLTNQLKPAYNQHQYGGSLGGHILRDKLLFFGNYEQYKIVSGQTVTTNVPTDAERAGDFSADPTIYDPLTTVTVGGVTTRQSFAQVYGSGNGNKIPAARWDTAANNIANVMKYYPSPNASLSGANYAATRTPGTVSKQGTLRVDSNISDKQHFFARYTGWYLADIPLNTFGNGTGAAGDLQRTDNGVLGDTYSFTANTTLDLRASLVRAYASDNNPHLGQDLAAYSPAWATLNNQVAFRVMLRPQVSGLFGFTGMPNVSKQYRDLIAIEPTLSTIRGKHTLKVGADIRMMDFNYNYSTQAIGDFAFDKSYTSANGTTTGTGGMPFASFMLGAVTSSTTTVVQAVAQKANYQGYYFSDTWQLKRNLTVNAGIRWELPGVWTERHDRATILQPDAANSLGTVAGISSPLKGALVLVNSSAWTPRSTDTNHRALFAPRIGVSYNPLKDTVVHAGFGITYLPFDVYYGASMPFTSPVNSATNNMVTSVNGAGLIPTNTLSSPYPQGGVVGSVQQSLILPAGRSASYLTSLNGLNISGNVPNLRYPYQMQWNFSIQQQLLRGSVVEVAYAGSRGLYLPQGTTARNGGTNNINQLADQYDICGTDSTQPQCGGKLLTASVTNPLAGLVNSQSSLNKSTTTAGQLLRPFPEFSTVTQTNAQGDNVYHALQLSFRKRFGAAGILSSNYTWAKNIGTASGGTLIDTVGGLQDFTNARGDRSVMNFDIRQRFITSFVLNLPFGHGQRFLNNLSRVPGGFVSGWAANGLVTLQSGTAVSLSTSGNTLSKSFGAGAIRPNVVAGCNPKINMPSQLKLGMWFNTACYTAPSNYGFGNAPRVDGSIRAAGIANYDLSINKSTSLTEKLKLDLRAEFFNLFNRVQFGAPSGNFSTASTFGTVTSAANQPRQLQLSGRLVF